MQFLIGTLTLRDHNYDFNPNGFELPLRAVTFEHFGQALAALIRLTPPQPPADATFMCYGISAEHDSPQPSQPPTSQLMAFSHSMLTTPLLITGPHNQRHVQPLLDFVTAHINNPDVMDAMIPVLAGNAVEIGRDDDEITVVALF